MLFFVLNKGLMGKSSQKKAACLLLNKRIYMGRHQYSLKGIFFEDIIIEKNDGKIVRIPTWNIIANPLFFEAVERYMLPHMTEEAQNNWISQFTEIQRSVYVKEFEENPKL
ncbi:DUF5381 family protein [Bacillus halotolerans]|uniref:DUF5381 family protein n=1 Tax=Bacillus halotolerans TaxID=260554 RepID=UPI002DBE4053|nr:DUF5381 family protein [Bacillus halotolerans]MEC1407234.1 DUF5381 family protein [Bacillus halotolerans]